MKTDKGKGSGDHIYRGGKKGGEKERVERERGEKKGRDREGRHMSIDREKETRGKRLRDGV